MYLFYGEFLAGDLSLAVSARVGGEHSRRLERRLLAWKTDIQVQPARQAGAEDQTNSLEAQGNAGLHNKQNYKNRQIRNSTSEMMKLTSTGDTPFSDCHFVLELPSSTFSTEKSSSPLPQV